MEPVDIKDTDQPESVEMEKELRVPLQPHPISFLTSFLPDHWVVLYTQSFLTSFLPDHWVVLYTQSPS